jgi:hypothetical protein
VFERWQCASVVPVAGAPAVSACLSERNKPTLDRGGREGEAASVTGGCER